MHESVLESAWIRRLKQGDRDSAEVIWNRYYERLVRLARRKLAASKRRTADEEDVVVSAFDSFFRGVREQRFPKLEDRHDLWQLLLMLTARKAADQVRGERRQKRGGGHVRGESVFQGADGETPASLNNQPGKEPTPEFSLEVTDQLERLLGILEDDRARTIALQKLAGYTNEEIAEQLACALRTVERKLRLIRTLWENSATS